MYEYVCVYIHVHIYIRHKESGGSSSSHTGRNELIARSSAALLDIYKNFGKRTHSVLILQGLSRISQALIREHILYSYRKLASVLISQAFVAHHTSYSTIKDDRAQLA